MKLTIDNMFSVTMQNISISDFLGVSIDLLGF